MQIKSIRILPNSLEEFPTEQDFRQFVTNKMHNRGGYYYFPNLMMRDSVGALVLLQYQNMIRAYGLIIEANKQSPIIDELGRHYAGYYKFDLDSIHYLKKPISAESLRLIYPAFSSFNQCKHDIPLTYLDSILKLLSAEDLFIDEEINYLGLQGSEKEIYTKARINQSVFRQRLISRYGKCVLCGISNNKLLRASHIKPWSKSNPTEKTDVENGFLMCPNHDQLFDLGLISFDDCGNLLVSSELSQNDIDLLGLNQVKRVTITEKNAFYLKYHRESIFKK